MEKIRGEVTTCPLCGSPLQLSQELTEKSVKQLSKEIKEEYKRDKELKQKQLNAIKIEKHSIPVKKCETSLKVSLSVSKPSSFLKLLRRKLYLKPQAYIRKFLYKAKKKAIHEVIKF